MTFFTFFCSGDDDDFVRVFDGEGGGGVAGGGGGGAVSFFVSTAATTTSALTTSSRLDDKLGVAVVVAGGGGGGGDASNRSGFIGLPSDDVVVARPPEGLKAGEGLFVPRRREELGVVLRRFPMVLKRSYGARNSRKLNRFTRRGLGLCLCHILLRLLSKDRSFEGRQILEAASRRRRTYVVHLNLIANFRVVFRFQFLKIKITYIYIFIHIDEYSNEVVHSLSFYTVHHFVETRRVRQSIKDLYKNMDVFKSRRVVPASPTLFIRVKQDRTTSVSDDATLSDRTLISDAHG